MNVPWRIELLGGLAAKREDHLVHRFRSSTTGALLAWLACHLEQNHAREELAARIWPEAEAEAGRHCLRQAITSLRRQLEPPDVPADTVLLASRRHVRLNPASVTTDVKEFEELAYSVNEIHSPAERIIALRRAVDLYRGDLLPGCFEDWVLVERDRLTAVLVHTLQQLAQALALAGEVDHALEVALRAVRVAPVHEELHCDLMRLYVALGRPADAALQYTKLRRLLRRELGVAPSADVRILARQIRAGTYAPPLSAASTADRPQPPIAGSYPPQALKSDVPASRRETNRIPPFSGETLRPSPLPTVGPRLPMKLTRFFGRQTEITRLHALLQAALHDSTGLPSAPCPHRLVTLTGHGGSGKTRLALEVADRLTPDLGEEVYFVPLANLTDPLQIPDAILNVLRRPRSPNVPPHTQVIEQLSSHACLLVLDNFEHLLDTADPGSDQRSTTDDQRSNPKSMGGAEIVQDLLQQAPSLVCLVTSRQRLELEEEQEFAVQPLEVPTRPGTPARLTEFPSVQMFVERAQAVCSDFAVTTRNAAAVAAICQRLEGLPLAIELAAARAQFVTPIQMLDQLMARFQFLVSRRRGAETRHQTLRAALDWSYNLLTPEQQRVFARLSVFRGGWTLEAAQVVCVEPGAPPAWNILDILEQLHVRSLITAEASTEAVRFRLLETLREYAEERMDEEARTLVRRRHADYFLSLAQEAEPHLRGEQAHDWLHRLEADHDNVRAALAWSLEDRDEDRPSGGRDEGRGTRDENGLALSHPSSLIPHPLENPSSLVPPGEAGLRLSAVLWRFWFMRGYLREGRDWLVRALSLPSSLITPESGEDLKVVRAKALNGAGVLAWTQGDCASARPLFEESLALKRAMGDRQGIASALNNLALLARDQGDLESARAAYEESLGLYRELGHTSGFAATLSNLGGILIEQGDYSAARPVIEESLAVYRGLGGGWGLAMALHNLGEVAHKQADYAEACARYCEGLAIVWSLGDRTNLPGSLTTLGNLAQDDGDPERAAVLFGAAEALRESIGSSLPPAERAEQDRRLASLRAALGAKGLIDTWEHAKSMELEEVVAYALGKAKSGVSRVSTESSPRPISLPLAPRQA